MEIKYFVIRWTGNSPFKGFYNNEFKDINQPYIYVTAQTTICALSKAKLIYKSIVGKNLWQDGQIHFDASKLSIIVSNVQDYVERNDPIIEEVPEYDLFVPREIYDGALCFKKD